MNSRCPVSINCVGTDDPVANFSAEAPDNIRFGRTGFPNYNPHNPFGPTSDPRPPFDPLWAALGCVRVCYSSVSLEDAQQCADNQKLECMNNNRPGGPNPLFFNETTTCAFTCPDGSQFFWTIPGGAIEAITQDLANQLAHNRACALAALNRICLGSLLSSSCVDVAYDSSFTMFGGDAPFTFELVNGSFPQGLFATSSENGREFGLAGTPNQAGDFSFTIRATDLNGHFMEKTYTIAIVDIANSNPLPAGNIGAPYSQQLLVTGTVSTPLTWQVIGGALPDGLSLATNGLISGTPHGSPASANFTVSVTTATGLTCSKDFTITINSAALDFANLAWQNAFVGSGGTGTASFTPSLANGATFHGSVSRTLILDSGACQNVATITYNGPALACNLHIVLNRSGIGTITGIVTWSQAPLTLFDNTGNPSGTYDIPFTIQDTGGVPVVVQFTVTMQISAQPDFPNSIDMVGTFSVV